MRVPWFRRGEVLPPLKWVRSPNQSQRTGNPDLIVVHDTEGGYHGSISWFENPRSQVSAHLVLREDGLEATQMVPFDGKAWHCAAFNGRAIGLEMAGFAGKGFSAEELRRAARVVAYLCRRYRIRPRLVKALPSGDIAPGVTFHQYLGVAGGGHVDPGFSHAEAVAFVALVQSELARGGFRWHWGR